MSHMEDEKGHLTENAHSTGTPVEREAGSLTRSASVLPNSWIRQTENSRRKFDYGLLIEWPYPTSEGNRTSLFKQLEHDRYLRPLPCPTGRVFYIPEF